jgi:peptidoglycan/LPS O-acetylase OafA/YrhL
MKYNKQLDGLRFIAIFLVLIEHFATVISRYISAGYFGVDLFFVISGFLITTILLRSKDPFLISYKKFIGRRTLRIFPIYYLTILVLYIAGYEYVHRYLGYVLTYTYNYAWVYYDIPTSAINHFWSLCVEEQFYLFWPFLILGLNKNLKLLKIIVLALVLVCSVKVWFNIFPSVTPYNRVGIFPRANSLGIGAIGAILYKENKIPLKMLQGKWLELLVIAILAFLLATNYNIKYVVCPILSLFFILKTTHHGFSLTFLNNFLKNKWVVYIGSISYGLYLFHWPLEYYMDKYVFDPLFWNKINFAALGAFEKIRYHSYIIKLPLYSFIAVIMAHFSYKYFERPILSLKDKYFKYGKEVKSSRESAGEAVSMETS